MEAHMNSIVIEPGAGLFIPGGIIHSLGKGLYFEVLADGDQRVLLQDSFAGMDLSPEERLGPLCSGSEGDLDNALEFVEFSCCGEELIKKCECVPKEMGEFRELIVKTPYFSATWIRIPPGKRFVAENSSPHVLVAVSGNGSLASDNSHIRLLPSPSGFASFSRTKTCNAVIVHATTSWYALENRDNVAMVLLAAYCGDILEKGRRGPSNHGTHQNNR